MLEFLAFFLISDIYMIIFFSNEVKLSNSTNNCSIKCPSPCMLQDNVIWIFISNDIELINVTL